MARLFAAGRKAQHVAGQSAMLLGAGAAVWLVASTVQARLDAQGIASGFGFLWSRAGYDLSESVIPYTGNDSYARALLAGFSNTLKVACCAIIAAVLIGTAAATAQLSRHDLVRGLGKLYVSTVRNTPLLLQLFFWFGVFTVSMPSPRAAIEPLPGMFISNRGINFPWPSHVGWSVAALIIAGLAGGLWIHLRLEGLGQRLGRFVLPLLAAAIAVLVSFQFGPLQAEFPVAGAFSIRGGGQISPEFLTLFTGLSVYTGSYIAEAIRGAILAIPKGQIEAGNSLGLRSHLVLLLIIIPQAMRIALPAVVSELLNLVKNSSLGVAVGYPELVSAGNTAMNQTGQAIELITIYMAVYVSFNFVIATIFRRWERRHER